MRHRWQRSPAQETADQTVPCSQRGIRQCRHGQSWNLFHGRRRERRRAAPGPERPEAHYRWRRSAAQETADQSVSCSQRGIRRCRRGQSWNLFHGRRRERRRAAPGPEQPETHYRWRRSAALETIDPSVSCSRRGIRQRRRGQSWNLFHGRRRERRRAAPGPEQPETHYRWRRSAAQGTNDQSVSCSRRGIRQRRRGQSWNLFHGRRRERRRAAPGPEQPETHYRWRRSAAQGTNDQSGILFAAWESPTPSWPELESFPWSAARAAPGGPRS